MIDLSHIPFGGRLSIEEQRQFEKRALALDDNDEPPIIIDKMGNIIDYDDEAEE